MTQFNDWYNCEALEIWRNTTPKQELMPLLIPEIQTDAEVLVVGINPSHDLKWINQQLEDRAAFGNYSAEKLFAWNEEQLEQRKPFIIKMEKHARELDNRYFMAVKKFVSSCEFNSWTHLDLFLLRSTNQDEGMKFIFKKHGMTEFGEKQIELFFAAIEKIKSKIVVVPNALASRTIHHRISSGKETHTSLAYNGKQYFFASMLSGGAMDIFSKERLRQEIISFKKSNSWT
jgi:hypothetical protein